MSRIGDVNSQGGKGSDNQAAVLADPSDTSAATLSDDSMVAYSPRPPPPKVSSEPSTANREPEDAAAAVSGRHMRGIAIVWQ